MDDNLQIIIYIIFFAIYLLSRALRNKNKQAPRPRPTQENRGEEESAGEQPMTFEDILRELTTGEKSRGRQGAKPKPKPVKREYEFRGDYPDDDEIQEVYEESVKKAQNLKTLNERIELKEPALKFKEYDDTKKEAVNPFAEEIRNMLRNPDDAKKAIILKEILDRKF